MSFVPLAGSQAFPGLVENCTKKEQIHLICSRENALRDMAAENIVR